MEIFTTLLAYGYVLIAGFVLLFIAFQILAFYIAGRITDSINDEITSAFTLFGVLFVIGVASALVNGLISTFLSGMLIPGIISFVFYLAVTIFAIAKIYELSIGKAILHLIISFIIIAVLTGLFIYLGTMAIPANKFIANPVDSINIDTNSFSSTETLKTDETQPTEGVMVDEPVPPDEVVKNEESTLAEPKLPGIPATIE